MAEPDRATVHRELKRKHVLSILWEEYIASEPGGYRYSRFCEFYRAWEGHLSLTSASRTQPATKIVRRLRGRRRTGGGRPPHRRAQNGAQIFIRRARRLELHLRAGYVDAGACRLDQRSRRHPGGDRRRAGVLGA